MKRAILRLILTTVVGLIGYLLFWPVPIDPVVWNRPAAPELAGIYAQNNELAKVERLRVNGFAPEDEGSRVSFWVVYRIANDIERMLRLKIEWLFPSLPL